MKGYRTLCMGIRVLSEQQFYLWQLRYNEVKSDISIPTDKRDQLQELLVQEIEKDLFILGASALEDELQDEVPHAIAQMREAGDKQETAENIGHSCRLFTKKTHILNQTKSFILQFLSDAIIICRASPSQKAAVVKLVKLNMKTPHETVLAIGDGSNDVAMIQAAHIGIGLYGLEGSEAASSSDYAIVEFKHIKRLIFNHGLNMAHKMNLFIQVFLFKSTMFAIPPLFFAFYNGYSGQKTWEDLYFVIFALVVTWVALFIWSIFEQQLPLHTDDKDFNEILPKIMKEQRQYDQISYKSIALWQLYAYFASAIVFFIPAYGMGYKTLSTSDGKAIDQFTWLLCSYITMVLTHHMQMCILTYNFSLLNFFGYLLSLCLLPCAMALNNSLQKSYQYKNTFDGLAQPNFWFCVLIGTFINSAPLYVYQKVVGLIGVRTRVADKARTILMNNKIQDNKFD